MIYVLALIDAKHINDFARCVGNWEMKVLKQTFYNIDIIIYIINIDYCEQVSVSYAIDDHHRLNLLNGEIQINISDNDILIIAILHYGVTLQDGRQHPYPRSIFINKQIINPSRDMMADPDPRMKNISKDPCVFVMSMRSPSLRKLLWQADSDDLNEMYWQGILNIINENCGDIIDIQDKKEHIERIDSTHSLPDTRIETKIYTEKNGNIQYIVLADKKRDKYAYSLKKFKDIAFVKFIDDVKFDIFIDEIKAYTKNTNVVWIFHHGADSWCKKIKDKLPNKTFVFINYSSQDPYYKEISQRFQEASTEEEVIETFQFWFRIHRVDPVRRFRHRVHNRFDPLAMDLVLLKDLVETENLPKVRKYCREILQEWETEPPEFHFKWLKKSVGQLIIAISLNNKNSSQIMEELKYYVSNQETLEIEKLLMNFKTIVQNEDFSQIPEMARKFSGWYDKLWQIINELYEQLQSEGLMDETPSGDTH